MYRNIPPLALTPAHVARVHREVADTGAPPDAELHGDAEYAVWVDRMIRSHPDPDHPTRLFAYGSLIWKPEIAHRAEEVGLALGWHRSFCLRMKRFRGTPESPGLMMVLDRGGRCKGMLYTLPDTDLPGQFNALFRREFTYKPINNIPRWITVRTATGPVSALAFVMNRASPMYAGRLDPETVAETLATCCGHWGSGAEYLLNTVTKLKEHGIHDSTLWHLQRLVAHRIGAEPRAPLPPPDGGRRVDQ